jgi:hypothetical protein
VLYIDRENPEGMVSDRARAMGIIANRRFRYWGDWSSQTPEIDDPRLMEFARREKGFIVFDSLQDWYGDASEIDNTAMVALLGKFRRLARAGAGVLLLHHQAKYREGVFRGGTAIVALTDMAFNANKSENDSNVIELRAERFRMCAEWEMDFRVHWNAGERHHNQRFYQLEVLRDELASEVKQQKIHETDWKQAAKEASDRDLTERLVAFIEGDQSLTLNSLSRSLGGEPLPSRDRIIRLAKLAGWSYSTENGWERV